MYAKVGQLRRKITTNSTSEAIKDETGKLLTEPEQIRNRWKEHIETLYDKNGKPQNEEMRIELKLDVDEDSKCPVILDSEVTNAIEALKVGKAIGPGGMPAEFWKVLGAKGTKELVELCKEMYVKGIWPSNFTRVVMILLQKKMNAVECSDHRTISLISYASKILLKIRTNRIEAKARDFIERNQFGFRKGCGARDAIGVMRMLCKRSLEFGNNVYICFLDFEKASDRVNWKNMMKV